MFRCVWMVSHLRSMVHVSFAVLCGVCSILLAAFLCILSRLTAFCLQISGTYQPSVPYPRTLSTQALTMFDLIVILSLGSRLSDAIVANIFCFPFLILSSKCAVPLSFLSIVKPRQVGFDVCSRCPLTVMEKFEFVFSAIISVFFSLIVNWYSVAHVMTSWMSTRRCSELVPKSIRSSAYSR